MAEERPEPRDALGHVIQEGEFIVSLAGVVYEFEGWYSSSHHIGAGYVCPWRGGEFAAAPTRPRAPLLHDKCVRVPDLELLRSAMVLRLDAEAVQGAVQSWYVATVRAAQGVG